MRSTVFTAVTAIVLLLTSCSGPGGEPGDRHLARVGDDILTVDQARERIPAEMLTSDSLRALQTYRDEWIRSRLLLQEADRLRLDRNPEVARKLQQARDEVLKEALKDAITEQFDRSSEVTEEEAQNYFQTYKDQFILNERYVRFRHVIAPTAEDAQAAKRELLRGTPWPEVARRYAMQAGVAISESEQFWPISMAAGEYDRMNRFLNLIGQMEISPIEQIDRNWHFVQLIDSRAEGEHPDLEWLIGQIREWLLQEKRRRHFSSYVKNLYLKAESNDEIDTYSILPTNPNANTDPVDTLESSTPFE